MKINENNQFKNIKIILKLSACCCICFLKSNTLHTSVQAEFIFSISKCLFCFISILFQRLLFEFQLIIQFIFLSFFLVLFYHLIFILCTCTDHKNFPIETKNKYPLFYLGGSVVFLENPREFIRVLRWDSRCHEAYMHSSNKCV